jgi:prepilin-type N-terminal cleavage/methylation domain-containing protein
MARRLLQRVRRDERGFTLMELLVATLLTAIGITAVVATLDFSRASTTSAEKTETAVHQAQRAIENVVSLDYDDIGLNAAVTYVNDPRDPRYYVRSNGASYQWDKADTTKVEGLVGAGALAPSSTWQGVSNGGTRFSGTVWRFVTWYYDPLLVQAGTDQPDAKRVIVAVTVNGEAEPRKPFFVSTMVRDPGDS